MERRTGKRNTMRVRGVLLLALLLAAPPGAHAQNYPDRRALVNDFAGVLSARTMRGLETLSQELLDKSGVTVAVAVVPSLEGVPVEEYATTLYERWGIGKKGEDRGVLLLVAVKERRVRIETGYGLEGILPDGKVGAILDEYVIPHLRRDDWDSGVIGGVAGLIDVIDADAGVTLEGRIDAPRPARRSRGGRGSILPLIIFLILMSRSRMFPWIFLPMMMGRRTSMGGGGFGSFGGGFGSFGGGGGGGFSGFGGGMSGGGGASRGF